MLQCTDCEFFHHGPDGSPQLACNPFINIKEPECLMKWQLAKLTVISESHQATLEMYKRLAPLQEKMFQHMEREINDVDEADRWKQGSDEEGDEEGDEEDDDPFRV